MRAHGSDGTRAVVEKSLYSIVGGKPGEGAQESPTVLVWLSDQNAVSMGFPQKDANRTIGYLAAIVSLHHP